MISWAHTIIEIPHIIYIVIKQVRNLISFHGRVIFLLQSYKDKTKFSYDYNLWNEKGYKQKDMTQPNKAFYERHTNLLYIYFTCNLKSFENN